MLKLYGYWRSTAAYRVRIALSVKQIPYESVSVHLVKNGGEQHSAEFEKLNPQNLVPVLEDGDFRITQSMAIIEYLDAVWPSPRLIPENPKAAAEVRSMSCLIASDIHPLNNLRVLQYLKDELRVSDDQKSQWYAHWIAKGFSALERKLETNDTKQYCFGNQLSVADLALIPQVYNANRFNIDLDPYPLIRSINAHCLSLAEVALAAPENQPDAP